MIKTNGVNAQTCIQIKYWAFSNMSASILLGKEKRVIKSMYIQIQHVLIHIHVMRLPCHATHSFQHLDLNFKYSFHFEYFLHIPSSLSSSLAFPPSVMPAVIPLTRSPSHQHNAMASVFLSKGSPRHNHSILLCLRALPHDIPRLQCLNVWHYLWF